VIQGREVVVFRARSGAARVLDAHCPHLGAHLGHGGEVRGETIRCPFHGFCFEGAEGRCTETGYGTRPPPLARAGAWPVRELGGVVMAFHGPGDPWDLPVLDGEGWTRPQGHGWEFEGRPQEIAENSVDLGHLSVVHGYGAPRVVEAFAFDGPRIRVTLEFRRPLPFFGRLGPAVPVVAAIEQVGLGFAAVHAEVQGVGLQNRFVVTSTSVDERRVALRVTSSVRGPWASLGLRPLRLLDAVLATMTQVSFRKDVSQDVPIWGHKRALERPAIAEGDGPLGKYRSWARQFSL
jgi:nitrite reductase/ring-hydroxylating ferredoxin subunit